MEHFICRCKHCGTQYTYCTYGNDDGCTEEYCGTCAKAIYDALRQIPIKFQSAKKMIIDPFEVERIVKIFNEEKEIKTLKESCLPDNVVTKDELVVDEDVLTKEEAQNLKKAEERFCREAGREENE